MITVVQVPDMECGDGCWESSSAVAQLIPEKPVRALVRRAGRPGFALKEGTMQFWHALARVFLFRWLRIFVGLPENSFPPGRKASYRKSHCIGLSGDVHIKAGFLRSLFRLFISKN